MQLVFSCRFARTSFSLDVLMNFHQICECLVTVVVVLVGITIVLAVVEYINHFSQKEGQAMVVLVLPCIRCDDTILLDLLVRKLAQWLLHCIAYLTCSE